MKYISLDLETTSLQPDPKNILMLSMVVEDTNHPEVPVEELPHFTCFVKQQEPLSGEIYALAMNGWILDILAKRTKDPKYPIRTAYPALNTYTSENGVVVHQNIYWIEGAITFIKAHFGNKRVTIAGKNVAGFDMQFLPKEVKALMKHKCLDPATLYVDWETDEDAPGLEECKKRAGINTPVSHDAREDAMDVIRIFRKFYS